MGHVADDVSEEAAMYISIFHLYPQLAAIASSAGRFRGHDVLDPAYAPATGTAEVGGWTTRELLSILDGLSGVKVIGADVVEVAPIYDNPGETTVLAAAEVVQSLIRLMVEEPVKALKDLTQMS